MRKAENCFAKQAMEQGVNKEQYSGTIHLNGRETSAR